MTDNMLDLAAIKSRCEAATPGPWYKDGPWYVDKEPGVKDDLTLRALPLVVSKARSAILVPVYDTRPEDVDFAALARTDVPALVAEVERLAAERDELAKIKRHVDEVRDGTGWTVQMYGVLLQQCDQYGKTEAHRRAEAAECERDTLRAEVERLREWQREVCDHLGYDSTVDDPAEAVETLLYVKGEASAVRGMVGALAVLRAQVARVEALAQEWDKIRCVAMSGATRLTEIEAARRAERAYRARAADLRDALAEPEPCPECGGLGGVHGMVHVRYGNGGGGNRACSRIEPEAGAVVGTLTCVTPDDLRAYLNAVNDAGLDYGVAGMDARNMPFIAWLTGPYADSEVVLTIWPWDGEASIRGAEQCDECGASRKDLGLGDLDYPVTVLVRSDMPKAGEDR